VRDALLGLLFGLFVLANLGALAYHQHVTAASLAAAERDHAAWHARAEDDRRDLRRHAEVTARRLAGVERRVGALEARAEPRGERRPD
jgi:hypothetical protein